MIKHVYRSYRNDNDLLWSWWQHYKYRPGIIIIIIIIIIYRMWGFAQISSFDNEYRLNRNR